MPLVTQDGVLKLIVYVGIRRNGRLLLVQYQQAPNPDKQGWWIPAPEVPYGEDPEEQAARAAAEFGFEGAKPRLMNVESFTMGGGNWHVMVHYVVDVDSDPKNTGMLREWAWFAADALPAPAAFAHGRWEVGLATDMLAFA